MAGGEYCAIWLGPELPGDQRVDDGKSRLLRRRRRSTRRSTSSARRSIRLTLVGRPAAAPWSRSALRRPAGRRLDPHHLWRAQSLPSRQPRISRSRRARRDDGDRRCKLDDIAYRVAPGHRLRVADLVDLLAAGLAVAGAGHADAASTARSTCRCAPPASGDECRSPSRKAPRRWRVETLREELQQPHRRARRRRPARSRSPSSTISARSAISTMASCTGGIARERWTIDPADPLSAHGETHWTQTLSRRDGRCAPRPPRRCDPTQKTSI